MKKRLLSLGICLVITASTVFSNTTYAYADENESDVWYVESEENQESEISEIIGDNVDDGIETVSEENLTDIGDTLNVCPDSDISEDSMQDLESDFDSDEEEFYEYNMEYNSTHWNEISNLEYDSINCRWTFVCSLANRVGFGVGASLWYSSSNTTPKICKKGNAKYYDFNDYYIEGYECVAVKSPDEKKSITLKKLTEDISEKKDGYYVLLVYNNKDEHDYAEGVEAFNSYYGSAPGNAVVCSDSTYISFDKLATPKNFYVSQGEYDYISLHWEAGDSNSKIKYYWEAYNPKGAKIFSEERFADKTSRLLTEPIFDAADGIMEGLYTFKIKAIQNSNIFDGKVYNDSDFTTYKCDLSKMVLADPVEVDTSNLSNGYVSFPFYPDTLVKTSHDNKYGKFIGSKCIYRVEVYKEGDESNSYTYEFSPQDKNLKFVNINNNTITLDVDSLVRNKLGDISDGAQYYMSFAGYSRGEIIELATVQMTRKTVVPFKFLKDENLEIPVEGQDYVVGYVINGQLLLSQFTRKANFVWKNNKSGVVATAPGYIPTQDDLTDGLTLTVTVPGYIGEINRTISLKSDDDSILNGTINFKDDFNGEIPYNYPGRINVSFTCTNKNQPKGGRYIYTWKNNKGEVLKSSGDPYIDLIVKGNYESGTIGSNNIGNDIYVVVTYENATYAIKQGSVTSEIYGTICKAKQESYGVYFRANVNSMNDGVDVYGNKSAVFSTNRIIYEPWETQVEFFIDEDFVYCLTDVGAEPNYDIDGQKYKRRLDVNHYYYYDLKPNTAYTLHCYYPGDDKTYERTEIYTIVTADHGTDFTYKDDPANYCHTKTCVECGESFPEEHIDEDNNGKCDRCNAKVYAANAMHIENLAACSYTGSAIKPSFDVYVGSTKLISGKDYTFSYKNNVNVGNKDSKDSKGASIAPTITVVGKGNYSGTVSTTFEINKFDLNSIEPSSLGFKYNGKKISFDSTLKANGRTLKNGTDYSIRICNAKNETINEIIDRGEYIIQFTGLNNYTGTCLRYITVTDELTKNLKVDSIPNQFYTTREITPHVTVRSGQVDVSGYFDVQYSNNIEVGTATVKLVPKDCMLYYGEKELNFKIVKQDLKNASFKDNGTLEYKGREVIPENIEEGILINGNKLDYSFVDISFSNNIKSGNGTCVIKAKEKGIYTGSKTFTYKINQFDVSKNENKILVDYNGTTGYASTMNINVSYSNGKKNPETQLYYLPEGNPSDKILLEKGKDYSLAYENSVKPAYKGTVNASGKDISPKIKVSFKGNYKGTLYIPYSITPKSLYYAEIAWKNNAVAFNNKNIKLEPTVTVDGTTLKHGTDYYIAEASDAEKKAITTVKDAKDYNLMIYGMGNYTDSCSTMFYVVGNEKKLISSLKVDNIPNQKDRNGRSSEIFYGCCPKVYSNGKELSSPDYEITYENNDDVGTATVVIKATSSNQDYSDKGEKRVNFKIEKNNFNNLYLYDSDRDALTSSLPDVYYEKPEHNEDNFNVNGNIQSKVTLVVKNGNDLITLNSRDFDCEWLNTDKVGTATLRVVGINAYEGCTKNFKFKVIPFDVQKNEDRVICSALPDYEYSGSAITPDPVLQFNDYTLVKGKDYTLSYKNNIKACDKNAVDSKGKSISPMVTVTFKGNFKGKKEIPFTIAPYSVKSTDNVGVVLYSAKYTGKNIEFNPVVTLNGKKLSPKTDYKITAIYNHNSVQNAKELGEYQVKIELINNYGGGDNPNFNKWLSFWVVDGKKVPNIKIDKIPNQFYEGGTAIKPTLYSNGKPLDTTNTGYSLEYRNNKEIGVAEVYIRPNSGNEYYNAGENTSFCKCVTFNIVENSIKNAQLYINGKAVSKAPDQTYTGSEIYLSYPLYINGSVYSFDEACTATFSKNTEPGTAKMILTGKGKFSGTKEFTFKIVPADVSSSEITASVPSCRYTGGKLTPKPAVKFKGIDLKEGTDYTLSYENNVNAEVRFADKPPVVIIKFKGKFKGTMRVPFDINQEEVAFDEIEVTASSSKLYNSKNNDWKLVPTVKNKVTGKTYKNGTDYIVIYSTNKIEKDKTSTYVGNLTDAQITKHVKDNVRFVDDDIKKYMASNISLENISYKIVWVGNYHSVSPIYYGSYSIATKSINDLTFVAADKTYTGQPVELAKEDFVCKNKKGETVSSFEIVEGSYSKNINAGTASVKVEGTGIYAGTKTVNFKIKTSGLMWWEEF